MVNTIALRPCTRGYLGTAYPSDGIQIASQELQTPSQHLLSQPFLVPIGTGWLPQKADSEMGLKFKSFIMESLGITSCGRREMMAGLGRGRNQAVTQPYWGLPQTVQGPPKPGWPFVLSRVGVRDGPLYPNTAQSLDTGVPGKGHGLQ